MEIEDLTGFLASCSPSICFSPCSRAGLAKFYASWNEFAVEQSSGQKESNIKNHRDRTTEPQILGPAVTSLSDIRVKNLFAFKSFFGLKGRVLYFGEWPIKPDIRTVLQQLMAVFPSHLLHAN